MWIGYFMLNVTLYTRKDSPQCNEVKQELQKLQEKFPHRLAEVDVESDPIFLAKYGNQVPVLEAGPYSIKATISPQTLQMTIVYSFDRKKDLHSVGDKENGLHGT